MRELGYAAACLGCAMVLACGGDANGSSTGGTTSGTDDDGGTTLATSAGSTDGGMPADMGGPEPVCEPGGGGPYWLLETETLDIEIRCMTGFVLPGADFSITPLPAGATYDPATARLQWTPGLDQGAVYDLTVEAISVGETGTVKIGVADAWDDPGNTPVDPVTYTEEYGLPVIHMQASPGINGDSYSPATIVYRGKTFEAESKLRGAVSLNYPKTSYTMKFDDDDRFSDPEKDFMLKRKVVLITTLDDNSYVRQRLGYELWNRLDPDHIQVQTYSGVLFLDGEYWGLYTIADHVDRHLMAQHGLSETGNLYKAYNHDANFRLTAHQGGQKATLHDGYVKSEGLPMEGDPGDFDDIDELVDFVATADSAQFLAEIGTRVDQRDYENWWIWVSFIKADDSSGKNSYHHHLPTGGQFRFVPWDLNHSFGQDWRTRRTSADGDTEGPYTNLNEMFLRFLAEPSIGPALRTRYGAVLGDQYELSWLRDRIDEMIAEIDTSALRDEVKWGAEYQSYWSERSDLIPYSEEVEYLRQWVADRWTHARAVYP